MINMIFRIFEGLYRRYVNVVWRLRLKEVGKNTVFDSGIKIYNPQNVRIGKNCVINRGVILQSCENGEIVLGDNVTISYNSTFLTCGLDLDKYQEDKVHFSKDIVIEDNVWIGANSTLLPGVRISSCVIVGAGSVVTKDIEPNVVVGGVPTKVIKALRS